MTTITNPALTTKTIPTDTGLRTWRLVATFVAGAILAGGASAAITAAADTDSHSSNSTTPRVVYVTPSGPAAACPASASASC